MPILLATSWTIPAQAQDDDGKTQPPGAASPDRPLADEPSLNLADRIASQFDFSLTPAVWLMRMRGDITLGPSPAAEDFSVENDFELFDLEPSPSFDFDILKRENWNLHFGVFDFSTDQSGTMPVGGDFGPLILSPGDAYDTSFDFTSFDVEASFRKWRPIETEHATLTFLPGAGIRWVGLEHEFTQVGVGSVEENAEWLALFASMTMNTRINTDEIFPLLEELEVDARIAAGPVLSADGGVLAEIGLEARAWFTPNLAARFGFRLLALNAEDDDYEFDGNFQGLIIGGVIRW